MGNSAGHEIDRFSIVTEGSRSGHTVAVPLGGKLRGVASLEVKNALQIYSVRIELVGRECTTCPFRDEVPSQTLVTHHQVMTVCGNVRSYRSSSMRSLSSVSHPGGAFPPMARRLNSYSGRGPTPRQDRPVTLPAGTYSIPFEFEIDAYLPPSLSYRSADNFFTSFTVTYELACCVRLAPDGRRLAAKCPVQLWMGVPRPRLRGVVVPLMTAAPATEAMEEQLDHGEEDERVVRTSTTPPESSTIAQIRAVLSRSWFVLDGSDSLELEVEVNCTRTSRSEHITSSSPSPPRAVEAIVASLHHRMSGTAEGHPYAIHVTPSVSRKALVTAVGTVQKTTLVVPVPKKACASLPPSFSGRLMRSEWSLRVEVHDNSVMGTVVADVEFECLSAVSGFCLEPQRLEGVDGNNRLAHVEDAEEREMQQGAATQQPQDEPSQHPQQQLDEPTTGNTGRSISTLSLPRTPYSSVLEYRVPVGMESLAIGLDRLPPIIREDWSATTVAEGAPEKDDDEVPVVSERRE